MPNAKESGPPCLQYGEPMSTSLDSGGATSVAERKTDCECGRLRLRPAIAGDPHRNSPPTPARMKPWHRCTGSRGSNPCGRELRLPAWDRKLSSHNLESTLP